MKTKKKTYLLLVLVLGVWGTIAYKIVTGLNPDVPELSTPQTMAINHFKVDTKIDTFSITTLDKDPFLGTVYKKKLANSPNKRKKQSLWLPIEYLGIVNSKHQKNQVFIVAVNGKQSLFKKGQSQDSITLLSGNKKRVTLKYKGSIKTFSIK